MVALKSMLTAHDTCSGFFTSHLHQNCTKDRLGQIVTWVSRELPDCFNDISVDVYTRSTDFRKELLYSVKVCVAVSREGELSYSKAKFFI